MLELDVQIPSDTEFLTSAEAEAILFYVPQWVDPLVQCKFTWLAEFFNTVIRLQHLDHFIGKNLHFFR